MFWSVGRSCLDHKSFWANEEVSKCATDYHCTIVDGGRRRARSPAIIDTASNHGDSLLRPVRKWMEEKSQKAPTVNLSAVGRPLHNIYMISTSLFILIVGIISVFLPSLSLSKVFLVSIIAIFRASLTQLCILAPLACWLVLSAAADLIAYLIKMCNNQISAK